ncbi:hypothetical protein CTU88_07125 [Streptomyces sp. JV178]|jgi:hypothetical protein|uniref:hypothetical protein n=1 Tax=unclassified Streptomyces TaxID=2593676 RepID=UPI000C1B0A6D|nr:hypothetical protein [Streptomyces sp. JV178]PIM73521.1 hypothetical protein CTU88_07125 [Streptomyces sp. JV178]
MKSTPRGTLTAVVAGVAAVLGAGSATPAVAAESVPVLVPVEGVEKAHDVTLPKVGGEVPLPTQGRPAVPRYVEGRLLPENTVPQVPLRAPLPGLSAEAPLPRPVGKGFERAAVRVPTADLRTLTPGLSMDAPVAAPDAEAAELTTLKEPQAALRTPVLRTAPTAYLGLGSL